MMTTRSESGRRAAATMWRRGLVLCVLAIAVAGARAQRASSVGLDLSGTWVEWQVLSEFATLPLVGEVVRTSTVTMRVTLDQVGDALDVRWTYCASEIDNGSAIASTLIPEAFLASLGEVRTVARLDLGVSPVRFAQPWTTEARGCRLEDPETDPLPTSLDDPRVIDQDGDGKPGLTVQVSALGLVEGEVYVVQRVRTRLTGTVISADRIEGLVEWTTEQVTLAASNPVFLGTIPSRPDPVLENSAFVLVRIDPAWTCAEIVDRRTELLFGGL